MPPATPGELSYSAIRSHWELFGGAAEGPHEARAILGHQRGAVSAVVTSFAQLRAFCARHSGALLCFTVQPLSQDFPPGRSANFQDVACVTNIFFDFDARGGATADQILPVVRERLGQFCALHDFQPFVLVNSGGGVHAYTFVEAIYVNELPDVAQRMAQLQREIRQVFVGTEVTIKVDSVVDLPRIVKLVGTRKPEAPVLSRFVDNPRPGRVEDGTLRQWLLDLRLTATTAPATGTSTGGGAPPPADHAAAADTESAREEIEVAISGSRPLRLLRTACATTNDRSKAEYAFVKELFTRRFQNARAIAAARCGIQGSKSQERGFRYALDDTNRVFRELEAQPLAAPRARQDRQWFFTLEEFLGQNLGRMTWIDEPLYAAGGTKSIFAGMPKGGKSFLLLHSALRAAVAGHRVFYIGAEGADEEWQQRIQGLMLGLDIGASDLGGRFYFGYKPQIDLCEAATLTPLRERIMDFEPSVVICDPLRYVTSGDENDSGAARKALDGMEWMIEDCIGKRPSYVVIHHTRKPQAQGRGGNQGDDRPGLNMRGSTHWWAGCDSIGGITFGGRSDEPSGVATISSVLHLEHRFAAEGARRFTIRFEPAAREGTPQRTTISYGQYLGNFPGNLAAVAQEIVTMLCLLPPSSPISRRQILERMPARMQVVTAVLRELFTNRVIQQDDQGFYSIPASSVYRRDASPVIRPPAPRLVEDEG